MKKTYHYLRNCSECGRFTSKGRPHLCPLYVLVNKQKNFLKRSIIQVKTVEADVAKQAHYIQFAIQPITFIVENKLSFNQGSAIGYICRYKAKNGVEDLRKAKVYIDYMIQEFETGTVKP